MCKGGNLLYTLLFCPWSLFYNIFDWTDYLELRVADVAIGLSLDQ